MKGGFSSLVNKFRECFRGRNQLTEELHLHSRVRDSQRKIVFCFHYICWVLLGTFPVYKLLSFYSFLFVLVRQTGSLSHAVKRVQDDFQELNCVMSAKRITTYFLCLMSDSCIVLPHCSPLQNQFVSASDHCVAWSQSLHFFWEDAEQKQNLKHCFTKTVGQRTQLLGIRTWGSGRDLKLAY